MREGTKGGGNKERREERKWKKGRKVGRKKREEMKRKEGRKVRNKGREQRNEG